MATKHNKSALSIREKIVLRLVLFLVQMIEPYEYEHQFKGYFAEMKDLINLKNQDDD